MLNERKMKKAVLKSRSNEIETQEKKAKSNIQVIQEYGYGHGKYLGLPFKCIVGCIFNSVGFIITHESPCIKITVTLK
jgi:hypothetical protein